MFYESKRQPYSFNLKAMGLGEGYLPFKRFEPFATYFGAMADMNQFLKEKPLNEDEERDVMDYFVAIMGGIAENLGDKTFMRSITDFAEAWAEPKRLFDTRCQDWTERPERAYYWSTVAYPWPRMLKPFATTGGSKPLALCAGCQPG